MVRKERESSAHSNKDLNALFVKDPLASVKIEAEMMCAKCGLGKFRTNSVLKLFWTGQY